MKVYVHTKNDCAEKITLDCNCVEWLIINKALRVAHDSDMMKPEDKVLVYNIIANMDIKFNEGEIFEGI